MKYFCLFHLVAGYIQREIFVCPHRCSHSSSRHHHSVVGSCPAVGIAASQLRHKDNGLANCPSPRAHTPLQKERKMFYCFFFNAYMYTSVYINYCTDCSNQMILELRNSVTLTLAKSRHIAVIDAEDTDACIYSSHSHFS